MPGKGFGDLQRMAVAVAVSTAVATALMILMGCVVAVAAVAAILLSSTAVAPAAVGWFHVEGEQLEELSPGRLNFQRPLAFRHD